MENAEGTIFVSIPTLLDPDLAPAGHHILHTFTPSWIDDWQNLSPTQYQEAKEAAAHRIISRLEQIFPQLSKHLDYQEVGTPRTHRRFLGREDGTYGPIPSRKLLGLLGMPFNRTSIPGLYCVGDSTFPGQGLNAVAFSGFACAHRIAVDLGL
jgi:prolycopene isomerase